MCLLTVDMCMKVCKDGMRIAVKGTTVINLTTRNSVQKVKYERNDSTTVVDSFKYNIHIETQDNHLKLFITWKQNSFLGNDFYFLATTFISWETLLFRGDEFYFVGTNFISWPRIKTKISQAYVL